MAYFKRGALVERFQTIVTAGGTTTLNSSSRSVQVFTGTQSQTVVLPDATTCDGGSNNTGSTKFTFFNRSTQPIFINTSGGARRLTLNPMTAASLTLTDDTTAAGVWRSFVADPEQQPLKLSASEPADALINISSNTFLNPDGTDTKTPPISNLIPTVVASTHNLQTGATSGATFQNAALPTTTVGEFRRIGYSLLPDGSIQVLYSAAAASVGALSNPGLVFPRRGLPIGWVDVEATAANSFKTAGSATNIVENNVGTDARIHRFGSGGGGGSGSGDMTEFLEEAKERLRNPENRLYTPQWMTPVILSDVGETLTASATATYNAANSSYNFTAIGQNVVSQQMLDVEFLESPLHTLDFELLVDWLVYDSLATYEVSLDGGANWAAMTAELVSPETSRVIATIDPADVVLTGAANNFAYPVSNADNSRELNAGSRQAYSFRVPANAVKKYFRDLLVYVVKSGTPAGNLYVDLVADNAGSIGTEILAQKIFSIPAMSLGNNTLTLSGIGQTFANQAFWVRYSTDQAYKNSFVFITNEIDVRVDASSPTYAGGDSSQFNGTVWSVDTGAAAVFSFTGFDYDLRWRVTSGTASVEMSNVAIFYGRAQTFQGAPQSSVENRFFEASTNPMTFTLTRFLPDEFMKVYDVDTGQVYAYGAFTLQGYDVIFPENTFSGSGVVHLRFEMIGAGGYDNSDVNASLLAANGLGSSDPAIDKSSAGVGIKQRAADGILYHIVPLAGGIGLEITEVV